MSEQKDNTIIKIVVIAAIAILLWKIYTKRKSVTIEPITTAPEAGSGGSCENIFYRPLSPYGPFADNLLGKGWCYRGDGSVFDGKTVSYGDKYADEQAQVYYEQKNTEAIRNINKKVIQFKLINSLPTKQTSTILNSTQDVDIVNGVADNPITPIVPPVPQVIDIDGNIYDIITIGNQQWLAQNLATTKYNDGTPIPNISNYNDYFLPSKDELNAMYTELHLYGVGGFTLTSNYACSTEYADEGFPDRSSTCIDFASGVWSSYLKDEARFVRACRAFTSPTNYNLRDIGQSGGLIFWKSGNDYLEAAPVNLNTGLTVPWSNVDMTAIGASAQGTAIGTGQANTTAIINQVGHTGSAAKLCDDLTSDMLWAADVTGAYCWYNNDTANKSPYGALYNWYAINTGKLAPTGWRVPLDADFNTLIAYLGGNLVAGGKLKEQGLAHWSAPNAGATDDYGFKSLPGGNRNQNDGTFSNITLRSHHHTSNDLAGYPGAILIDYDSATVGVYPLGVGGPNYGFSVRCMRDI